MTHKKQLVRPCLMYTFAMFLAIAEDGIMPRNMGRCQGYLTMYLGDPRLAEAWRLLNMHHLISWHALRCGAYMVLLMRAARHAGEPGTGGEQKTALPLLEFRMHSHTETDLSTFKSTIATSVTSGTAPVEELTGGSLCWSSGTTSIVTVKLSSVTVEGVTAESELRWHQWKPCSDIQRAVRVYRQ
jgi:hypothetical protein